MNFERLPRSFFKDSTEIMAQKLLGTFIVHATSKNLLIGKIVETESYTFNDPASHCYQKRTLRNQAMFGPVGHAYIYKIYGIHYGFNIVAHNERDQAGGVLIRAVEPIQGIEIMHTYRPVKGFTLTNGPAKFTQAFNIDKRFYSLNLLESTELFLAKPNQKERFTLQATPRIGISKACDYKGRFMIKGNNWVTPHRFNKEGYGA